MAMEELTGFGMKNSTNLPRLANKYLNSLRDGNDEPLYTYTDPFMRHFAKQSIKGGRCTALSQWYKSTISDEVFNLISKDLNIIGDMSEILDKYFEYTNKQRKIIEHEYDLQFDDYRDNDEEERNKHINKELSKLAIHKKLQKLNLNDVMMDFDATSLFFSAMGDVG